MSSENVGVWRRGGQGGRGRGFPGRDGGGQGEYPDRDRGSQGDKENQRFLREDVKIRGRGRGFSGNEGGTRGGRNNRGNASEHERRDKIVWGTARECERSQNDGKTHEMDDAGKLVGRCNEFCPLEEKRMRTKERLLHR